jgi:hypothetical protein
MENCLYNKAISGFDIKEEDITPEDKQLEPMNDCAAAHLIMAMGSEASVGTKGEANCAICAKHVTVTATGYNIQIVQ